jgi:hypothetical protein
VKRRHGKRTVAPPTPAPAAATTAPVRQPRSWPALVVFAAVFTLLQVFSYPLKSAIWDEPVHLATGYLAVANHDYRLEPTHPPLMRMWAALPLLFMRDVHVDASPIDRTPPLDWHSGSVAYDFATKFLYVDNDADRLLTAARFMSVICGIVLGILVWGWTHEWFGPTPALAALLFYTLSPNVMANTSLVTTDVGITCFMFGTIYFLWRTCRRVSLLNLAGLTTFFALAIVTKFSAVLLGPMVVALLLIVVASPRSAMTTTMAANIVLTLTAASFFAVWAVYGFRYAPSPTPGWELHLEHQSLARTVPVIARVTAWVDGHHLLPNMFTEGFLMFAQSMKPPNYTFLAGAYSTEGWWYYFPVAFLIKTPIAFLALIAIGLVVCVRRRDQLGIVNEAFIAVPVLIYLGAAVLNTYQVGVRHILPLYPLFIVIAAAGSMELVRRPAGRVVLAGLTVLWIVVLVRVYPYTLTFFNQFVGGPRNGYKFLADSNVDWGQGLKLLKRWMDRESVSRINLAYFGTADPAYYGIDYTTLPAATPEFDLPSIDHRWTTPALPGYVAVSATVLTGVYLDPEWRLFYRGIRDMAPVAVLGNSMFVYRLERWPEAPPLGPQARPLEIQAHLRLANELMEGRWFDHAAFHYRQYLKIRPNENAGLVGLGLALASSGALAEAIPALRRALERDPDNGPAQLFLADSLFDVRADIQTVIAHARRAVALLPSDSQALVTLGRALAVNGQYEEAIGLVHRALQLTPNDDEARQLERLIDQTANQRQPS